ncbi:MAG: DUF302 domain-containing protein [Rhodobacteraceae bacterium]|nr:DUF302 domain-containing protein [Paracoccaceae bacterium]
MAVNSPLARANDADLIRKPSPHSVSVTLDKAAAIVKRQGGKVFARIDHALGAESIYEELRPTQTLIFGNPKAGTPLMQANQEIGLDLPIRLLAYQDEAGQTHLVYRDPVAMVAAHGLQPEDSEMIARITDTLDKLTDASIAIE